MKFIRQNLHSSADPTYPWHLGHHIPSFENIYSFISSSDSELGCSGSAISSTYGIKSPRGFLVPGLPLKIGGKLSLLLGGLSESLLGGLYEIWENSNISVSSVGGVDGALSVSACFCSH